MNGIKSLDIVTKDVMKSESAIDRIYISNRKMKD